MAINFPEGTQNYPTNIVQTRSSISNSRYSVNSTSWNDVSGLSVSITPENTGSRILVMVNMGAGGTDQGNYDHGQAHRILRNGNDSNILGASDGSRQRIAMKGIGFAYNHDHMGGGFSIIGVDHPNTTSSVTYKLQVQCQSRQFVMNGCPNNYNTSNIYHSRSCSHIIVQEFLL